MRRYKNYAVTAREGIYKRGKSRGTPTEKTHRNLPEQKTHGRGEQYTEETFGN